MEYSKIIAVSGLPGLYELINSKNDGAVIRSLDDKSTRFASSRIHNFSHLESIEVYTTGDNVNLVEIFNAIENATSSLPDSKDNDAVKKYFEGIYPDLDFEKVYSSDLKKMVKWYEVLKKNNIEIKLSEPAEEEPEAEEVKEELVIVADAPKKPVVKKTAAAPKEKVKEEKEKPKAEKTKEAKEAKATKEEPKKKAAAKTTKESAAKEKPKAAKPKSEKKTEDKSSSAAKKKK